MTLTNILLRFLLAFFCGLAIGSERQIHHRTAGLRTNILVAIGACAFVICDLINHSNFNSDLRISAQIVTGIGFIGGGVILKDGFNIKGLTTAATLWCSAAAGMLAGAGHFEVAGIVALLVMCVNSFLRPLSVFLNKVSPDKREYVLKITCDTFQEENVKWILLKYVESKKLNLKDIRIHRNNRKGLSQESYLDALILSNKNENIDDVSHEIAKEAKINSIMWETLH